MCGIAGWVAYRHDLTGRRQVAEAMTETMTCRGPDDSGLWLRRHAAMGRRLAVIDVPGGVQPMTAETRAEQSRAAAPSGSPQRHGAAAAPSGMAQRQRPAAWRSGSAQRHGAAAAPSGMAQPRAGVPPGMERRNPVRSGAEVLTVVRSKDYGPDVLAGDWRRSRRREVPQVEARAGLVVEDANETFCGAVVGCEKGAVTLEDGRGKRRVFPLGRAAFLLEGKPVTLVRPAAVIAAGQRPDRTPSGSRVVPVQPGQRSRARTARASRIYVEGTHDAELVEKIWGDDLREEGVVVEYLEGVDSLPEIAAAFGPGPGRCLGVLVDHLVEGSKEARIAASVSSPHVLVTGHEFIDIWQAVKPAAAGIPAWPDVPRGVPWKEGVLRALGWDLSTGAAWRRLLGAVRSFADLEPGLLRSVEELIDFVTEP